MSLHLYLLAVAMGALMSVYIPMISQSARIMGAAVMGNVPFFFVAFMSSVMIALAFGQRAEAFRKIQDVPAWLFLAGVFSALIIVGASYLVPKIGTGPLFVMLVAGQILAGIVINQFGLLGVPVQPATPMVAIGAFMVIAGAGLVTFGAAR